MAGLGTIFVELDLDKTRWERSQRQLYNDATSTALSIEKNFKNLGIKSSAEFDLMRQRAQNAFDMISNSAKATANDRLRAEQALATQLKSIHEQQYGVQLSMMDKLKSNWIATSIAVTAGLMAAQRAWGMAEAAANFEQSSAAFHSMAQSMGADADKLYDDLREKSANLIDQKSLTEAANRAMSLGIPVEKLGALMEIARVKARDMGITTSQAFNDIATGVGRGSSLILDNLGLVLKVGSANEAMAQSLGKSVEQLTDKEKKMAILNATIDAGKEALSRYNTEVLTTAEKMQRLKTAFADLQLLIGQAFVRAAAAGFGALQSIAASLLNVYGAYLKIKAVVLWLSAHANKLAGRGEISAKRFASADDTAMAARAADEAAADLRDKASGNFDIAIAKATELSVVMAKPISTETGLANGVTKTGDAAKKAADEYARLVERANEWKRTASLNQETSDMGTFRAELEKNAAEAEKLKSQFAGLRGEEKASVYTLIEKEELRKNEIARLKEEAAQTANAVEGVKKQAKAEQELAEIRDAATEKSFLLQERTINNRIFELDLAKQAGASYREQLNERIALEQQLLDIALKRLANTSEVTDYASYAALEKDIQRFRTNIIDFQNANTEFIGTFLDGWERAYAAWNDQTITWATAGKKIFNDLSMNLTSSMGDMFFSTIKGQFDDLGDAFKSFCDNMLRAFTDMLAQMAVKGMMETISSGVSGVMGLIGFGSGAATGLSAFGGSAPSISGPVFSSGLYFHRGGIVGETAVPSKMLNASLFANAPRFHNGLAYDEFPAILQKGEAVIPKDKVGKDGQQSEQGKIPDFNLTIVAADAKSFSDMVKRNPGAIIKPITDALKSNAVNKEWRALLA